MIDRRDGRRSRVQILAMLLVSPALVATTGCGGEEHKATDPEIVSRAERAVAADARTTLEDERAADLFRVESVSCTPFSDRQLDCSGVLAGPEGSGPDSGVDWRAIVDPETGEVEVEQRSGLR